MFTLEEQPKPQLEVYALGRGHAIVNGQQITNWDGALPRNLFFYFLDHPLVTRDEIFAVFWPRLNVKEATNVYHVTKRKISERISMKVMEPGNYELTRYGNGFYMPSEKIVRHYDVFDFQDAVEQAMVAEDDHREELLYRRAIDLYKAPYLEPLTLPWIVERRDQLRQLYAQALIGMGRIYKTRKNPEKALGFFTRSLREMPEREDIHREVMALYLQLGMVRDAQNQFQLVSKILKDSLKIKPSRETRELYKQVESQL
jgi:two-component SAPR family response regulator